MEIRDKVLFRVSKEDFDENGKITVPKGIVKIDCTAFLFCNMDLYSIEIPEGVEEIESFCFYRCENLSEIRLPKSLKKMGDLVFYDCHNLQGLEFPEGMEVIGKGVFTTCDKLETVIIPQSVKKVGCDMFYGCDNLKNLAIPKKFKNEMDDILGGYFVGRAKPNILFIEPEQEYQSGKQKED